MKNKYSFEYNEYEIIDAKKVSSDTVLFKFSGKLIFEPGQFVQVCLDDFGEGTYAPCNDPDQDNFFELCVRGCGNLSNQLIKLLPGDRLKIRGPYGNGWPIGKLIDNDILILSGGIGLVPLRPLLSRIIKNKDDFGKVSIISGFKTLDHVIFQDDFEIWQKKLKHIEIRLEYGSGDDVYKKGMITSGLKEIEVDEKTIVLICGPDKMCQFCDNILLERGIKEKNIYISFERRMECGIGICQHCNIGKYLVCEDGPVFRLDQIKDEIGK